MKSEVYMSPEMKLLFLKVERIICASFNTNGDPGSTEGWGKDEDYDIL